MGKGLATKLTLHLGIGHHVPVDPTVLTDRRGVAVLSGVEFRSVEIAAT